MTNLTESNSQPIEALFHAAASNEPELVDPNFVKVVLNRLPEQEEKQQRQWLPDLVGIVIALLAIWWVVEPARLMQNVAASIPESVIISVPNMLLVALTLFATSTVGWWIVERES